MDTARSRTTEGRRRLASGVALALLLLPGSALRAGSITSPPEPATPEQREKHLASLGVPAWHVAGLRGQGVKVAVLDTGFRGYRDFLGKALPAKVNAHSFRADGDLEARDSQHGIRCAEVVHALAPDAELLFANWDGDRPEQFLDAVRWARDQGARVVTCSVVTPTWSDGEGGGSVHERLARLLGKDVLCFDSAGIMAQRHCGGD
jgi:hypothetical protein